MSESGVAAVAATLDSLTGLAPWRVRLGHGSFVTMDFGRVVTKPGERVAHGEWHLWVYMAAWRIDSAEDVVAGSGDSREVMSAGLARLEGVALRRTSVVAPGLGLELDFGEVAFRVFPVVTEDGEHWMLFTPPGDVLSAGPGTAWGWEI